MTAIFKILLFFFIVYFLFNRVQKLFSPNVYKRENEKEVRIFKSKELEKAKMDMHEAETIEFEEIEIPRKNQM